MRLSALQIEGFGHFHEVRVAFLPRLGVFTGANESGKTTLLEFVRFVLFGDRAGAAGYPALAGGRRGGRLVVESAAGERCDLERLGSGRTATLTIRDGAGNPVADPEARMADLLAGLDRDTYERIFALGADELQGLGLLDDRNLVRRLAAAAAGTPALPAALARLDREIAALSKGDRARKPRVNMAFLALEEAVARQRAAAGLGERFRAVNERLESYRQEARERAAELERERHELEVASRAQPLFERRDQLRARLASPALEPRPVRRGVRLAVAAAGTLAALGIGWLTGSWAAALGLAGAAIGWASWRGSVAARAAARRRAEREPLERELEVAQRELATAAGTSDPAEFAERLARRRARLRELEESERALQREIGRGERELETLGRDHDLEAALADRAAARTELDRALAEWARRALCRELLERARARHEAERRPRVLATAQRFLDLLLGTAPGTVSLVGDERLALRDDARGLRREGQWSSGLADQIYLAVRLAFAHELGGTSRDAPPLILDDVHLRFDPVRRRGLARALVSLAREGRQVLVFSCQPELASDLAAESSETDEFGLFQLAGGRIERER